MNNIKRLVFDLDNTLIMWKDEYVGALKDAMEEHKVDADYKNLDAIIESQEQIHEHISKDLFLNDINTSCNLSLGEDFVDTLLKNEMKMVVHNDNELIETIRYLSTKYELVVLTNWFTEAQKGRLKEAGILEYFDEVYGGDIVPKIKPDPSSFYMAIGNHKPSECIMIGDNDVIDIEGAINVGMNVIQRDYKNKITEERDYPVIKDIAELIDIL